MSESTLARFHRLAAGRLAGRKVDVVGFVDALLQLVAEVGDVHCAPGDEDCLHVAMGGQSGDIELAGARAKLRMVCARIAVLCSEAQEHADFVYGGEGTIRQADGHSDGCRVEFRNTASEQDLHIIRTRSACGVVANPVQPPIFGQG